jgi:O-6-methylguanine DNA methyltransferase
MTTLSWATFSTPIGTCGLVWNSHGILRLFLPESESGLIERLRSLTGSPCSPTRIPAMARTAMSRLQAHLAGTLDDFAGIPIDLTACTPFQQKVYAALRAVPPGSTISYGELARHIGAPRAARAVGAAVGANPAALLIPCHRVLGAQGALGGFSAPGGTDTKKRLLQIEGVPWPASPSRSHRATPANAVNPDVPLKGSRKRRVQASQPLTKIDKAGPRISQDSSPLPPLAELDQAKAIRHLRRADPLLGRVISRVGPCTLEVQTIPSTFEALLEAIVYQQLTGKAAATIFGRVRALFGRTLRPFDLLRCPDEELRGAGLSGPKIAAARDLAEKTLAGAVPDPHELIRLTDEEIIARLTAIRGIGRWTAEMLLIFRLGRPDVLAVDDYGLRKGLAAAHGLAELPSPRRLAEIGERWRPYRTIASWYLWRAAETRPTTSA